MPAQLPTDWLTAIDAHPNEPLVVTDDRGRRFCVVAEEHLTHLEAAAKRVSEASLVEVRKLVAEADASRDLPAETVHAELLSKAKAIDASAVL